MVVHILNPDRQWFKKTISQWLRGVRPMDKYEYILDHFIDGGEVNVVLPVTGGNFFSQLINRFRRLLRFRLWLLINGLDRSIFKVRCDFDALSEKDVVFGFFHDNFAKIPVCCSESEYRQMVTSAVCKFLLHLNHYVYGAPSGSELCSRLREVKFVAETRLDVQSDFFSSQFPWYKKKVEMLPFCIQDRFQNQGKFPRNRRAVSTGAVTFEIHEEHFVNHFGTTYLQPQRKYLLDHSNEVARLDVASVQSKGTVQAKVLTTLRKRIAKAIGDFASRINFEASSAADFYTLDLVDFYNDYSYVICSSEIIGLPGIGAFEAAACGAILFEENGSLYAEYGLEAGRHFVEYDGSVRGLAEQIEVISNNPELEEMIRENMIAAIDGSMRVGACLESFSFMVSELSAGPDA